MLQTQVGAAARTDYFYGLNRLASLNSGVKLWYAADALGSVRRTVTDAGVPLGVITYDPWGTPETGSVPTFGFTGEVQDASAGLVNLRARWYSTARGRFTSADSWMGDDTHAQSLNAYGYVGSNPVGLTDPSGHCYPPIEFLRQLEPLNCSNLDQAARIIKHPNASTGDKIKAGAYVGAWALGHAGVLVGLGVAAIDGAPEVAAWAINNSQMYPDIAAGIEAAGINITLQQAALHHDQTAQSILANPIGVVGCNIWGGLGEVAAEAAANGPFITNKQFQIGGRLNGELEQEMRDAGWEFGFQRGGRGYENDSVFTGKVDGLVHEVRTHIDPNFQNPNMNSTWSSYHGPVGRYGVQVITPPNGVSFKLPQIAGRRYNILGGDPIPPDVMPLFEADRALVRKYGVPHRSDGTIAQMPGWGLYYLDPFGFAYVNEGGYLVGVATTDGHMLLGGHPWIKNPPPGH